MKRDGAVRCRGVSCDTAAEAEQWLQTGEVDAVQIGVSLLAQQAIPALLGQASGAGAGIVARQCFAAGVLAKGGSMRGDEPPTVQSAISDYEALAKEMGRSLAEVAYRFVSDQPGVSTTLIGIRTPEHVRDALWFAESPPLSPDEMEALVSLGTTTAKAAGSRGLS
jgi:aryl-alcohol dehydrogenase-like predicted oxidoreductase